MKKFFITTFTVICTIFGALSTMAAESTDRTVTYPGFVGTPLIGENYMAEPGAGIKIGTSFDNLEYVTDSDPFNFSRSIGLSLTVPIDEMLKVMPTDAENATVYGAGTKAGFILPSQAAGDVSVLNVDVLKFVTILFYKPDGTVEIKNGATPENDSLLDLGLVSLGNGQMKVVAEAPCEFIGLGVGFAGVNIEAGTLEVCYAFIDNAERVPIIKQNFPMAKASTAGWTVNAKQLIDNNLTNGPATAVLSIGGAYFNVETGSSTPLPQGAEVGFHVTSGEVLNLDLGKAVKIRGIYHPLKNGKPDMSKTEYIDLFTNVDVVGLGLAGGGSMDVSVMTPFPGPDDDPTGPQFNLYGLRLELITGVQVELGATVVNYAYINLLEQDKDKLDPDGDMPFNLYLDVVPKSECTYATKRDVAQNKTVDHFFLSNYSSNPLRSRHVISDKDPLAKYWSGWDGSDNYIAFSVFRRPIKLQPSETEESYTYVGRIYIRVEGNYKKADWQFLKPSQGSNLLTAKKLSISEDGIIDLSEITFDEPSHNDALNRGDDDMVAGHEYMLMLYPAGSVEAVFKNPEHVEGLEIATDETRFAIAELTSELAGTRAEVDPDQAIDDAGTYKNYVTVEVPLYLEEKEIIDRVILTEHNPESNEVAVATYELETKTITAGDRTRTEYTWKTPEDENVDNSAWPIVYQVYDNMSFKLYLWGEMTNGYDYSVVCQTRLGEDYKDYLEGKINPDNYKNFMAGYSYSTNGINPVEAYSEYTLPELSDANTTLELGKYGTDYYYLTHLHFDLNDAADSHPVANDGTHSIYYALSHRFVDDNPVATQADEAPQSTFGLGYGPEYMSTSAYYNNTDSGKTDNVPFYDGTSHKAAYAPTDKTNEHFSYTANVTAYIPVVPKDLVNIAVKSTAAKARARAPQVAQGNATQYNIAPSYLVVHDEKPFTLQDRVVTGVENVAIDETIDGPAQYYDLQGHLVDTPVRGHLYIKRQGTAATKVLIK